MVTWARVVAVGGGDGFSALIARTLGAAPDEVEWLPSIAKAHKAIGEGEAPGVVVLGPSIGEEDAIALAELASHEAPLTAVVVVRDEPIDGAFPRLVRSGVRDVVDLSQGTSEIREVLTRAVEWAAGVRGGPGGTEDHAGGPKGGIVSVFSTKGGTGKTFIACNLAAALAERSGSRVALVDLDHDLGDVFAYFGMTPRRSLHELLVLEEGADAEAVSELGTTLVDGVTGFGSPPDPQAEPIPGASMTRMLRTLRGTFPYTVVDATAEYSDPVITSLELSDVVCLVSGLDAIAVRHLSIAMQTLERLGVSKERLRIVLNRANSKVDLMPEDVERLLGVVVDARIPSSALVPRSINRARLVWTDERRSDVAKAIGQLADGLRADLSREPLSQNGGVRRKHRFRRRG